MKTTVEEKLIKTTAKEEKITDFVSKMVKPHKVISRVADESDLPRLMEDAHILYNLCYTQIGMYPGGFAVAHSQITDVDPLRFFVTSDKKVIINPQIIRHTEHTVDSAEGCLSFPNNKPINVQRYNKIEVVYEILTPDGRTAKKRENLSGKIAKIYQHEIGHMDCVYIFKID